MPGNYQRLQIGVNSFTVGLTYALTFVVISATAAVCQKVTDNVGQCMAKEPEERNLLTECGLYPECKGPQKLQYGHLPRAATPRLLGDRN